jgi:hypothetical protein
MIEHKELPCLRHCQWGRWKPVIVLQVRNVDGGRIVQPQVAVLMIAVLLIWQERIMAVATVPVLGVAVGIHRICVCMS